MMMLERQHVTRRTVVGVSLPTYDVVIKGTGEVIGRIVDTSRPGSHSNLSRWVAYNPDGEEVNEGDRFLEDAVHALVADYGETPGNLCECGCGEQVTPGKRFIYNHYARTQTPPPNLICADDECGKPIHRPPAKIIPGRNNHCSKECYANAMRRKGARKHKRSGYMFCTVPGHPNADKNGAIAEHRLVMSERIGRPLRDEETVHHINGLKDDNRIENLELWASRHPAGQRVTDLVAFAREILADYGSEDRAG